ncbi:MAG: BON domain-containing protein [Candidatus Wallbacteria bacterium]|nr:BON domain-containing protein [Candidatus Wallbacteria bacterium]
MKNNTNMQLASDAEIESQFIKTYVYTAFLKDDHLKISSENGAVTLTGNVPYQSHKDIARDTAGALPGVTSVDNRIVNKGEQTPDKSDSWIGMKVKMALLFHRSVSGFNTEVIVKNGRVTLKGEAGNTAQKDLTTEFAQDIDGVESVTNEMSIAKAPPKKDTRTMIQIIDDASITAQVKSALLFHRSTRMLTTDLTIKEGKVTLTGKTKNQAEKDLVTKYVSDIHGVKSVENNLTVTPN